MQHGSGCLDLNFLGSLEMEYAIPRDSMRHAWSLPGFRYLFRSAEQVLERLGHRRVAAGLANRGIPDTGRSNGDLKKTFSAVHPVHYVHPTNFPNFPSVPSVLL